MDDNLKEIRIENYPRPITIEGSKKIISQMENNICKIYKKDGGKATGFFCKISSNNLEIPVFITNNHVIDDKYIKENKIIKITLNDDKEDKTIQLIDGRKYYTNKDYDITIIEIQQEIDKIYYFMELDEKLFKEDSNEFYNNQSVYIIHYPQSDKAAVSYGIIGQINDHNINHYCYTETGSSGSPIINLLNHKIIGIHKEGSNKKYINIGTFLKNPIIDFINNPSKIKDIKKKDEIKKNEEFDIKKDKKVISNSTLSSNTTNTKKEMSELVDQQYGKKESYEMKINDLNIISPKQKYFPKGLKKCPFNCYINSLLQCFYYIPELRNFFLETELDYSMTMCNAIKDIMIGLKQLDGNNSFIQKKLINEIQSENIDNATDLINYIFDKITIELSEEENSSDSNNPNETRIDDRDYMFYEKYEEIDFDIIINRYFIGLYEKEFKCKNDHFNYSFKSEYKIIFPLEEISKSIKNNSNLSIYDCFEYYQRPQKIKSNKDSYNYINNNYLCISNRKKEYKIKRCFKCKEEHLLLTEKIYLTPKILIIILDRGPNQKYKKPVKFDIILDLKKYMSGKKYEYSTKYKLIGVCSYLTLNGNCGSYISFCLCDDDKYYYFNDEEIKKVKPNNNNSYNYNCFCDGCPYILVYKRFEKSIEKIIKILKIYLDDMIKKINKDENKIKSEKKENMIKYTITSKDKKNRFDFEIDFNSENLYIIIYIKELKNEKKKEYKWNFLKSIKENEDEFYKFVRNSFEKFNYEFFIPFKPIYD